MGLWTKKCAYCGSRSNPGQMIHKMKWTGNYEWFHPACAAFAEAGKRSTKQSKKSAKQSEKSAKQSEVMASRSAAAPMQPKGGRYSSVPDRLRHHRRLRPQRRRLRHSRRARWLVSGS